VGHPRSWERVAQAGLYDEPRPYPSVEILPPLNRAERRRIERDRAPSGRRERTAPRAL
jgi:hypothetical protein